MVLNLDPFLSPIHTRFDLHPFTSFQPLPLFTLLPQSVFWSFEYATRPTTFIFRPTFFYFTFPPRVWGAKDPHRPLYRHPLLLADPPSTTWRLPRANFRTCRRVYTWGEAHDRASALQMTPQFKTARQRHRSCVIVSRGLGFWWPSVAHVKTAGRYRRRIPTRPYQDTLIHPDPCPYLPIKSRSVFSEPFPHLRAISVP